LIKKFHLSKLMIANFVRIQLQKQQQKNQDNFKIGDGFKLAFKQNKIQFNINFDVKKLNVLLAFLCY